jgi:hypothetical protein
MARPGPSVLILTQNFDPTADPVVTRLRDRGARVVRVDLSYFPLRMTFTSSDFAGTDSARPGPTTRVLRHRGEELDLTGLSAVWYRRPTGFHLGAGLDGSTARVAHREAVHGVGGLLRATDCLWVNRPDREAVARLKPYQLAVARRLAMRVPATLQTNDPDEVAALLAAADRPLVYKAYSGGVIHYPGGFPTSLVTTVVGEELVAHLGRVRHTMCIFQEYVEKAYEVRLTVVGNTYFPVVIRSQDLESTRVDWRADPRNRYGDYHPLPAQLVRQVQALLADLDLGYAALDFIVTPAGEYVFLEVNPDGQYMWLTHDLRLPISDRLADLLMTGGRVDRGGEVTQIGY